MPSSPPDRSSVLQRRTAGLIIVIAAGLVFVGAVGLLDWFDVPKLVTVGNTSHLVWHGATLWKLTGNEAGVVTVIAVGAVAFAGMALLSESVVTALPAVCGSFALLGQIFPDGFGFSHYRVGYWLAMAAALAMAVGGVVAVAGAGELRKHS
jgi:hypothetical protein